MVLARLQVLTTFFSFRLLSPSTLRRSASCTKGPFLTLLAMKVSSRESRGERQGREPLDSRHLTLDYLVAFPRFRPRTMCLLDAFLRARVFLPSGLPQGDTGGRPPEVLPSPPPSGWSTGFLATPRTLGRLPSQRFLPALPTESSSCSALPTSPTVARQRPCTRRISLERSRSVT